MSDAYVTYVGVCFRMKHYAEGVETLKAELYSRFVLLLNEKKAKIRSLQEAFTKLQQRRCWADINQALH